MSISYIKQLCITIACLLGLLCFSQEDFQTLGESSFQVNHKVTNAYQFHFATRSRYVIYREEEFFFKNRQIDLLHFSTWSLNFNRKLSFGIQYRLRENFEEGNNELRLTQQFNYTKQNFAIRYGHRARLEQRIFSDFTIVRYRYRFAIDVPFNGEKLDIGEGYFIGSMEALLSQGSKIKPELDHRTTLQVGWLLSSKFKLQGGLEYRFEGFNIDTEQSLFILTSAILRF